MQIKIQSVKLVNFIGLYNGLGKKEVYINLDKLQNKKLILILGENGGGKSTLSSVLHPFPGTTDKRNTFIRDGKEGLKEIEYIKADKTRYKCKIVYSPTKTGHSCKCFLIKYVNDEKYDLNPNGNVSSYEEALFNELGVTEAVLKLANQNDMTKGLVDMTSTDRKVNMSKFLPDDIYSAKYAIIDKTFKEMRVRINIIVDNIGKLPSNDEVNKSLEKLTKEINILDDKRDKCIGKIKEYETKISILEKDEDLKKLYKKTDKYINKLSSDLSKLKDNLFYSASKLSINEQDTTINNISKLKETISSQIIEADKLSTVLSNNLDRLKHRRNDISEDLTEKTSLISTDLSNKTLSDLNEIYNKYITRYDELNKSMSKLDTNLTKDDLLVGCNIISTIRDGINNINGKASGVVSTAINHIDDNYVENTISKLTNKKNKLEDQINNLSIKISSLNNNSYMKEILNKRPHECKIDACPFIENATKWIMIEPKLNEYQNKLTDINKEYMKIIDDLSEYTNIGNVKENILSLLLYVKNNFHIITKLPYNNKYSNKSNLLKCIEKDDGLVGCDNFDSFIDILECKEEYLELKYKKIPSIENEIHIMKSQGKFIEITKNEINKLTTEKNDINNQIDIIKNNISSIDESITNKKDVIQQLDKLYEAKILYDNQYDELLEMKQTLKELESHLIEIDECQNKLKDKKDRLKEIEHELLPLTKNREIMVNAQINLKNYNTELDSLQKDMYIVSVIRDALSVKTGIPMEVMGMFMDEIRQNANTLLSTSFYGSLYLEEFEINEKEFTIPYKRTGDIGKDISYASSSERSFISLALTLAMMEDIIQSYGILILDEIDRGFSDDTKATFSNMLNEHIETANISQTFMVTHDKEYYESGDVGYILFPGHGLKKYDDNDVVKVY